MIGIKIDAKPIKALQNKMKLYAYIINGLNKVWRDAIQAFIVAAGNRIHVDTGMSIASLYALGTKVKFGSSIITAADGTAKLHYTDIQGRVHKGTLKSKTLGKELGKKATIVKFARKGSATLHFEFQIAVFQWLIHENDIPDHNTQPPWEALSAGKEAFLNTFNASIRKYLKEADIYNFFATGEISSTNPLY